MKDFIVHIPTRIFFGESHSTEFFKTLKEQAKNVLLVTGGGSVERNGYLEKVTGFLSETGTNYIHCSGIEPNPLSSTINKIAADNKSKQIDAVLALGGGSVMDASKAIASLLYLYKENSSTDLDIWDYVLGSKSHGGLSGALPIFTIPTTAATASEVTPFSVISNLETRGKSPLAYEFLKPTASLLLPSFTTLLPEVVTRDGASDILSHVFENYFMGGSGAEFTDRYCEGVIKTVIETLPRIIADPLNVSLRGELMWCSTVALNGMHLAGRAPGPFVLHAIEHAMSAVRHELAHGRGLATLFPAYFRWLWNKNRAQDRLSRLGVEIFGLDPKEGSTGLYFIEKFEKWLAENDLLQSVSDLGFNKDDLSYIAKYVISTYGGGKPIDALGPLTEGDVVEILELTESQRNR